MMTIAEEFEEKAMAIHEHIKLEQKELAEQVQKFENEKKQMELRNKIDEPILELNVGGTHFTTYKSTLCKYPDSMLAAMFSGRYDLRKDQKGRFFIDRPPKLFEIILNWLRTDTLSIDVEDTAEKKALQVELDYFGLSNCVPDHLKKDVEISEHTTYRLKADRFKVIAPRGWSYQCAGSDAIGFKVNTNIKLHAIGLFGSSNSTAEVIIAKGYIVPPNPQDILVKIGPTSYSCSSSEPYEMMLPSPLAVQANMDYVIIATVSGGDTPHGTNGQWEIILQNSIKFNFFKVKGNSNGTDTVRGQIPRLIFST